MGEVPDGDIYDIDESIVPDHSILKFKHKIAWNDIGREADQIWQSLYRGKTTDLAGDKAIGYELVGQSYEPIEGLLIYGEGNDNAAEKYAIDNGFRYWNVNNSE